MNIILYPNRYNKCSTWKNRDDELYVQQDRFSPSPGSNAVNGIKSGDWDEGSCTSTEIEQNPWMALDLHSTYTIVGMQIVNRNTLRNCL